MGRPPKQIDSQLKKQARQDELDRIPIEGKFGQAKRRFSLSKIMCKLARTSETAIAITFIVLNIERWLNAILFCRFLGRESDIYINFGLRYADSRLRYVDSKLLDTPVKCILMRPESALP